MAMKNKLLPMRLRCLFALMLLLVAVVERNVNFVDGQSSEKTETEMVTETEVKSKEDLDPAEDKSKDKRASEVPEDGPLGDENLVTATDDTPALNDLDPKGSCSKDIKKFCKDVPDSAADCIGKELKNEEDGTTPVTGVKVSDGCKEEWRSFKISFYKSWDQKIVEACTSDMEKFCFYVFPQGGSLACLRENKDGLSQSCQDVVFKAEQDAVNDFKMDPLLGQMCSDDADTLCKGISPGGGRIQTCLRAHIFNVSYNCHAELFRQERENAGDLRLNLELYKACLPDKMKFCPTVEPGKSRLKDCLENNRLEPRFSKACKAQFDKMLARRSSDYRLNPVLKQQCSDDIIMLCDSPYGDSSGIPSQEEPKVIHCLEDYMDDIKNKTCKDEVHRLLALAAEDYHFDKEFSDACEASKQKLCNDVANDLVLSCLQGRRETLDNSCRAAVFKMEWRLSGDIDYKVPMKRACVVETKKFCDGLQHDHGDIIDCLQRRVDDEEMGSECKKEIVLDQLEAAKDYRLNYRLFKDCKEDVTSSCEPSHLCSNYEPCGGKVLKCLQEKADSLSSDACKTGVRSFEIKESKNMELNLPFQKACHDDLTKYCGRKVLHGRDHSKALTCLRAQRSKLTKECKAEELRFSMMEASDIRLTPSLMNACGAELRNLCPNVSPLNGEAFKCLQLSLESINMGVNCKVEVDLQGARQASDYRLDVRVRNECKEDVAKLCGGVGKNDDGHAAVMKCFVQQFRNLTGGCQTEVAYAARMALWQYQYGSDLTSPCDEIAKKLCNSTEAKPIEGVYHGTVGQCLITQRRRTLVPECKALVVAASQRGAFAGNSTDADLMAAIVKFEELRGGDDLTHSGIGFFWVTTMVAFVAILAVALFRRYSGPPKNYTLVVKGGDL